MRAYNVDSGVEFDHPKVGAVAGATAISVDEEGSTSDETDTEGDLCSHETACAAVSRPIAATPERHSRRAAGDGCDGAGKC